MQKPSIPRGTRDFNPDVMVKRNYIFKIIKHVFEKYGFVPIETPAMENIEVLTGKYGDEGEQLMFRVINSGDFLTNVDVELLQNRSSKKILPFISSKALRYDLTVPFARFVAMNKNQIQFPFKRYQIQPVWRADRPQKGRYREFYQCDADVVGTNSLLCEWEAFHMIDEVFTNLGLTDFTIVLNHRGILHSMAEYLGLKDQEVALCTTIDKLEKIGYEGVKSELIEKGFPQNSLELLKPFFDKIENLNDKLDSLNCLVGFSDSGKKAINDLKKLIHFLNICKLKKAKLILDCSLARGMGYYTGCIWEVKSNQITLGSLCGGGRYDNLTGVFGLDGVSGVGFSFGIERIYDVLSELKLFPENLSISTNLMLATLDEESFIYALELLHFFRSSGIRTILYPDIVKLKKQLSFADHQKIPYTLIIGSEELSSKIFTLKNMQTGEMIKDTQNNILKILKSRIALLEN